MFNEKKRKQADNSIEHKLKWQKKQWSKRYRNLQNKTSNLISFSGCKKKSKKIQRACKRNPRSREEAKNRKCKDEARQPELEREFF